MSGRKTTGLAHNPLLARTDMKDEPAAVSGARKTPDRTGTQLPGVVRPNRRKFCRPSSEPAPIAFQAIRVPSPLVRETSTVWLAHGSP